ncbi:MAG: hypothetical protein K8T25_24405 [Planctomycetia bacterium]|nr:hypothetical protein [Planctomycetia bacterium]
MPNSVLEAIQQGQWNYEPEDVAANNYGRTKAMPGTAEKIEILAERLRSGLPLWHPADRVDFDDDPR